jgi:hypothetical protein
MLTDKTVIQAKPKETLYRPDVCLGELLDAMIEEADTACHREWPAVS